MKTYFLNLSYVSGRIEIQTTENSIQSVSFVNRSKLQSSQNENENWDSGIMRDCIQQLEEYFLGRRKEFSLDLNLVGTEFQKRVWSELIKIPYGETISYLELAKRLGDEKVIRAAASANGKNRLAILIPCHRVIGANGSLMGYAGGIENKKLLLELEKRNSKIQGGLF